MFMGLCWDKLLQGAPPKVDAIILSIFGALVARLWGRWVRVSRPKNCPISQYPIRFGTRKIDYNGPKCYPCILLSWQDLASDRIKLLSLRGFRKFFLLSYYPIYFQALYRINFRRRTQESSYILLSYLFCGVWKDKLRQHHRRVYPTILSVFRSLIG